MDYQRKPPCFKSDYQIEETRRKAITAAYQTLYKELYEENKKLKKNLAQIQRSNFMAQRSLLSLGVDLEHLQEDKALLQKTNNLHQANIHLLEKENAHQHARIVTLRNELDEAKEKK